jgi:hypothetical protein
VSGEGMSMYTCGRQEDGDGDGTKEWAGVEDEAGDIVGVGDRW